VSELVVALEMSLYGRSTFSRADLESEWSGLGLDRDVRVVRDGARVVGHGAVGERGELGRVEGDGHPDWLGRAIGRRIATELEAEARRHGTRRVPARRLRGRRCRAAGCSSPLGMTPRACSARCAIGLAAPPPEPRFLEGYASSRSTPSTTRATFTPPTKRRSSITGPHAARFRVLGEAPPRERALRSHAVVLVRAGREIVAGSICASGTYAGGFVDGLFGRRG
jgi:hypothetical protein